MGPLGGDPRASSGPLGGIHEPSEPNVIPGLGDPEAPEWNPKAPEGDPRSFSGRLGFIRCWWIWGAKLGGQTEPRGAPKDDMTGQGRTRQDEGRQRQRTGQDECQGQIRAKSRLTPWVGKGLPNRKGGNLFRNNPPGNSPRGLSGSPDPPRDPQGTLLELKDSGSLNVCLPPPKFGLEID